MKKTKTNIAMYEEVAQKLGLETEYVQSTPTRKPLLISNGKKFFLLNTKSPGFYPEAKRWNAHFTSSKLLTQKILKRLGYNVIRTEAVRVTSFTSPKDMADALKSNECQYPCIVKPDKGQDGADITIAENLTQLIKIACTHFLEQRDFLIQPILTHTEYRILVINDEVVLMHSKHNQCIVGDGVATIQELLSKVPESKKNAVYIAWQHKKHGTKPSSVLKRGEQFEFHLTKIPTTDFYVTKKFPRAARKWALKLAEDISSPVVGIDVFIPDSFDDTSTYTVIELNTNPAVYYLPTRCNDDVTGYKIIEKVLRDYFKI